MKTVNLRGVRFGKLVVQEVIAHDKAGVWWKTLCDCGGVSKAPTARLRAGRVTSCGCAYIESARRMGLRNARHGHARRASESRTYRSWQAMIERCDVTKPDRPDYKYYAGRGIRVCDRWRNSFEDFVRDIGERPDGKTLDRIDPEGHYEPGNCRWATASEQRRNQRPRQANNTTVQLGAEEDAYVREHW